MAHFTVQVRPQGREVARQDKRFDDETLLWEFGLLGIKRGGGGDMISAALRGVVLGEGLLESLPESGME